MLFTYPGDELSCQKLIYPPDLVQISSQGCVKSNPQDYILNIKLGRKRHAGEESISVFLCGCFLLWHVLITVRFLRNINTRLFPGQKIKWLICVLSVRYPHTDAGMHAGQLRHVGSCSLKAACQVREIWETRSHQSGPDLSNETFLLRRSVTDLNDE